MLSIRPENSLPVTNKTPVLSPVCNTTTDVRFTILGKPRRIWAIGSIHADSDRLTGIHNALYARFCPGDRIVYLGNFLGHGSASLETMAEILKFRRTILAMPGVFMSDLVYLRGAQEEMLQKVQELQFSPSPSETLRWMLGNGLGPTLEAYGITPADGVCATREGVMSITRWTCKIREAVRRHDGHIAFSTQLRRAAYTLPEAEYPMLFVNSGINPDVVLAGQGDSFWWGGRNFNDISTPYLPFQKVVRGFDPRHSGVRLNCVTATLDGGSGFGGTLVCAGFERDGTVSDMLEA